MDGIMGRRESDSQPRLVRRACDREGAKLAGEWGSVQFKGPAKTHHLQP